jgi:hypothetical protein
VLQERLREIHEQEVHGVHGVHGDRSRLESCMADEATNFLDKSLVLPWSTHMNIMIYHDITMIYHDNILIEVIEVKFVICVDLQMFIAAGRFQGPIHQPRPQSTRLLPGSASRTTAG